MSEKYEYCRQCGTKYPRFRLSNRGYCKSCSQDRNLAAIIAMQRKEGPLYEKWRICYLNAMRGVIARLNEEIEGDDSQD